MKLESKLTTMSVLNIKTALQLNDLQNTVGKANLGGSFRHVM